MKRSSILGMCATWAAAAIWLNGGSTALGDILVIETTRSFANQEIKVETPGWLTATITDVTGGGVDIKLTSTTSMPVGAKITEVSFNSKAFDSATPSGFSGPSTPFVSGGVTLDGVNAYPNGFQADGDGKFDIKFDFPSSENESGFFGPGESITIGLKGVGLSARSFNTGSFGDKGGNLIGVHFQGLSVGTYKTDSTWSTGDGSFGPPVPEPTTMIAGAGALGLLLFSLGARSRKSGVMRIGK